MVFLLRQSMSQIPKELDESAVMDGASTISVFLRIVIPLSRPIIASAMLLDAMRVWNEFMFALTFVLNDKLKTSLDDLKYNRGRHMKKAD